MIRKPSVTRNSHGLGSGVQKNMVDHNSRVPLFQHKNRITWLGGSYSSAVFSCMKEIGPGRKEVGRTTATQLRSRERGNERGTKVSTRYPLFLLRSRLVASGVTRGKTGKGGEEKMERRQYIHPKSNLRFNQQFLCAFF